MEPNDTLAAPVQLQDRTLPTSVSLVVPCPTMDLLALVLDANSVSIFRTSWHKLANIPVCSDPSHSITALAWSPTGANLVIATSDAELLVHSVDRAASALPSRARRNATENEPVARLSLSAPATALHWTPPPSFPVHYDDRASALYPNPPDSVSERGLLFVGDRQATLSIFTSNLKFTIAKTSLLSSHFFIQDIFLTNNLRNCLVVMYPSALLDEPSDATPLPSFCAMRCTNMNPILDFWPELERIAREVVAINALIHKFADAEQIIRDSWANGALEVLQSSIIQPLQKLLSDFGEHISIWDALYDIFCGARVTGATLQFLGTDLSVNGAKEVLRLFRSHVSEVREGVATLVPMAECASIRASEYRSLTRLTERFAPVGFLFNDADALVNAVEAMYFRLDEFATEVNKIASMGESFLAWLVLVASKAGGESMQGRVPANVDEIGAQDMRLVFSFFQLMTSDKDESSRDDEAVLRKQFTGAKFTDGVLPAVAEFRAACEQMMRRPAQTISPQIEVSGGIEVGLKVQRQAHGRIRGCVVRQCGEAAMDIIQVTAGGIILCARLDATAGIWTVAQKCLSAEDGQIEDVGLLADGEVVVTVSGRNVNKETEEARTLCELATYKAQSNGQLWDDEAVVIHGEASITKVIAPDATVMATEAMRRADVAMKRRNAQVHLSVNVASGLVSVLIEPRRLVLLELQTASSG